VAVRLDGNEKDSGTVLGSVTADGDKLPLFAIAKGKTRRAERSQFGSDETLLSDYSPSGWGTVETFRRDLDWLAGYYEERISPEHPLNYDNKLETKLFSYVCPLFSKPHHKSSDSFRTGRYSIKERTIENPYRKFDFLVVVYI
jgi:hypothetical protein